MMAKKKEYAVYEPEGETLVALGPPGECAGALGVSERTFHRRRSRPESGIEEIDGADAMHLRPDCFAMRGGECAALNRTYCRREYCGFYKTHPAEPKALPPGAVRVEIKMEATKMENKTKLYCAAACGFSGRCDTHVSQARGTVKAMDDLGERCFFFRPAGGGERVSFLDAEEMTPETEVTPEAEEIPVVEVTPEAEVTPEPATGKKGRKAKTDTVAEVIPELEAPAEAEMPSTVEAPADIEMTSEADETTCTETEPEAAAEIVTE